MPVIEQSNEEVELTPGAAPHRSTQQLTDGWQLPPYHKPLSPVERYLCSKLGPSASGDLCPLPPSLPASTRGNTTAMRFKKFGSCPPAPPPLFLDVRFQPSPHHRCRRGAKAAPGQTRLPPPPRRGPPRYLVVVQVGQRQHRIQRRRGAQLLQQRGELHGRQAMVGPEDPQHVVGEGLRGAPRRRRRAWEHLQPRGTCRVWLSAQHVATPPHRPRAGAASAHAPGAPRGGSGSRPARPLPGGCPGETGRAAARPCPTAPDGRRGSPALFGPRRGVRLSTERQPSPAGPGLRAAAGPPPNPASPRKGGRGVPGMAPRAGKGGRLLRGQGSQNHRTHPRRHVLFFPDCPKCCFQTYHPPSSARPPSPPATQHLPLPGPHQPPTCCDPPHARWDSGGQGPGPGPGQAHTHLSSSISAAEAAGPWNSLLSGLPPSLPATG